MTNQQQRQQLGMVPPVLVRAFINDFNGSNRAQSAAEYAGLPVIVLNKAAQGILLSVAEHEELWRKVRARLGKAKMDAALIGNQQRLFQPPASDHAPAALAVHDTETKEEVTQLDKDERIVTPAADASSAPPMKLCSRCKVEKPATSEHFARHNNTRDGLQPWCKACLGAVNAGPRRAARAAAPATELATATPTQPEEGEEVKAQTIASPEPLPARVTLSASLLALATDAERLEQAVGPLRAENARLTAMIADLKAENAAVWQQLASLKATGQA